MFFRTVLPSWNLNELLRNDTILNKTTVFKNGSRNSLNSEVDMFSEGMAVDYSSGNVYWVEREPTTQIHVTSSDGVHDMSLVREKLSQPREISLHVPRRWVFCCEREFRDPFINQRFTPFGSIFWNQNTFKWDQPKIFFLKASSEPLYTYFETKRCFFFVKTFQKLPKNNFFWLVFSKFVWRRKLFKKVFGSAKKINWST